MFSHFVCVQVLSPGQVTASSCWAHLWKLNIVIIMVESMSLYFFLFYIRYEFL